MDPYGQACLGDVGLTHEEYEAAIAEIERLLDEEDRYPMGYWLRFGRSLHWR
jgi:hypothetical protein